MRLACDCMRTAAATLATARAVRRLPMKARQSGCIAAAARSLCLMRRARSRFPLGDSTMALCRCRMKRWIRSSSL